MQIRREGESEAGTFATQERSGQRARQARHEQSRGYVGRRGWRGVLTGDGLPAFNDDGPGYRGLRSKRQAISESRMMQLLGTRHP